MRWVVGRHEHHHCNFEIPTTTYVHTRCDLQSQSRTHASCLRWTFESELLRDLVVGAALSAEAQSSVCVELADGGVGSDDEGEARSFVRGVGTKLECEMEGEAYPMTTPVS